MKIINQNHQTQKSKLERLKRANLSSLERNILPNSGFSRAECSRRNGHDRNKKNKKKKREREKKNH